jgi:hypothetical protein
MEQILAKYFWSDQIQSTVLSSVEGTIQDTHLVMGEACRGRLLENIEHSNSNSVCLG